MEEKKININVSSIGLLEKENSILKPDLNSNESKRRFKPELITGVLIWCLGVIACQKKVSAKFINLRARDTCMHCLRLTIVINIVICTLNRRRRAPSVYKLE